MKNKIQGLILGFIWGFIIYDIFDSIGELTPASTFDFLNAIQVLFFVLAMAYIGSKTKDFIKNNEK